MGLECLVGQATLVVPVEAVSQVIEYDVDPPPPLCAPWLGGLGALEGKVLVSIALRPDPERARGPRRTRGIRVRADGFQVVWAIEVVRVASFVRVTLNPPTARPSKLPAWLVPATSVDGKSVAWLDAALMLRSLSSPRTAGGAVGTGI
jgi:chemotaxis signal transduction protein